MAGLSVPRFAANDSVPYPDTLGASLLLSSQKANTICWLRTTLPLCASWLFCRLSFMSCAAYSPLPSTPCGDRSGLHHFRDYYALC